MKNMTKKQKIILAISALIIVIGAIIIATVGLNFDLRFQEAKKIQLYLGQTFEIKDIKEIVKETIPDEPTIIQKVEVFEDTVSILAKDITEEQKQNTITKINEKYGTEISADSTEIVSVPNTRGRDIIKPYVWPFVITTAIILVYMSARYRKLGVGKTIIKVIGISVLAQATLLGVMAITRIPIGRLTIPMVIIVYLLTMIGMTTTFEKQLLLKDDNSGKTKK